MTDLRINSKVLKPNAKSNNSNLGCCGSKRKKKNCADINLNVTVESLPPTRIGYFFQIVNNGPLPATNAELTVLFTGPIEPPTQAGWKIDDHVATYALGTLATKKLPIDAILTFSTISDSIVIATVLSNTLDCGKGNNSVVSSYSP